MAIDPSIALGVRQYQAPDQLNQLAQVLQIQQGQQSNELNRLKMGDYQQQQERRNALLGLAKGWGADTTDEQRTASLKNAGFFNEADALEKSLLERMKAKSEAQAKNAQVYGELQKFRADAAKRVLTNPTPENAIAAVNEFSSHAKNLGLGVDFSKDLETVSKMQTPEEIQKWASGHALNAEQSLTMFNPKPVEIATGGRKFFVDQNPLSKTYGQRTGAPEVAMEQTPDSKASVAATLRGQTLTDQRARDALAQGLTQYDSERGVLVNKNTGQAMPVMSGGSPLGAKMKPAVEKELLSINQQRAAIQGALKDVESNPNAFGFGRGMASKLPFGESIAGRMESDQQTQARSYLFNNVSKIINERAGAAQSAQELSRLNAFLPADTDNAKQIANKLKAFDTYLNDIEAGTRTPMNAESQKAPAKAPAQLSGQDKQAIDWANANPNDPRAAAIKKKLGM